MRASLIYTAILLVLACEGISAKEPGWFCEEESGKRDGNKIYACGVGEAMDEMGAREKALETAISEFKLICALSVDCKDKPAIVTPMRMSCSHGAIEIAGWSAGRSHWKCYRLIVIALEK